MPLLPYFYNSNIVDGVFIQALPYCKKNCTSLKCKAHYDQLRNASPGFYVCPCGLSSLVFDTCKHHRIIYSGMRVRGFYHKSQAKKTQANDEVYNPVLDKERVLILAKATEFIDEKTIELSDKEDSVNDLLHETRKFNGQIKNICDSIWSDYPESDEELNRKEVEALRTALLNIQILSYLTHSRFSYYDTIANPDLVTGGSYCAVVYKKFDKFRKLFKHYKAGVWISIEGNSKFCYPIYPTFETLLFLLLENAIKYATSGSGAIKIHFREEKDILNVSIVSRGPYCSKEELERLTEKKFRGRYAKMYDQTGQGIGLSLAKKIADLHRIGLEFNSINSTEVIIGIKYGDFIIKLHFEQCQSC